MIALLVGALAVYRITLLITHDLISEPLRQLIADHWPGTPLDTLVNCAWCTSVWIGLAVTLILLPVVELPFTVWLLLPFAFSAITVLAVRERLT